MDPILEKNIKAIRENADKAESKDADSETLQVFVSVLAVAVDEISQLIATEDTSEEETSEEETEEEV